MSTGIRGSVQTKLYSDAVWAPCGCRVCVAEPGAVFDGWASPFLGQHWRADVHRAFEVGVLVNGMEEKRCGGSSFRAQVGDAWLIPAYEVHAWRPAAPNTVEATLHFLPEVLGGETFGGDSWLRLFACPPDKRPRPRTDNTRTDILAAARMLIEEVEARPPAFAEGLRIALLRLLLLLYRAWDCRQSALAGTDQRTGRIGQIMPALNLLFSAGARRVSLTEAAAACGLTESYFDQRFRATMGMPFARFEIRERLVSATRLLANGRLSVEAIAHEIGFVDASHLHRRFAEVYGCTPGQYRAGTRGQRRP